MTRRSNLLLAILLFCAAQLWAQVTPPARDITVQVSAATPGLTAGLDLQSGDVIEISSGPSSDQPSTSGVPACDPRGVTGTSVQTAALPLPTVPPGALIARLHAHGAAPTLVGASRELHVEGASHLFLGMNISGAAPCQGDLAVKVHITPAGSSTTDAEEKPRSQQLKSELGTAAQVFLSGQFGIGKSEAGPSNATVGRQFHCRAPLRPRSNCRTLLLTPTSARASTAFPAASTTSFRIWATW